MFNSPLSYLAHFYGGHTPSELLRLGITNIMHHLVLGDQLQNAFVMPTAQDDFSLVAVDRKATPMVTWSTNFTRMTLSIWQDVGRGVYDGLKYAETEPFDNTNAYLLEYPWDSLYSLQNPSSSNWYLSIKDDSGSGKVFNSTYFTINDAEQSFPERELRKREDSTNTFTNPPPIDLHAPVVKDYSSNPNYAEGSPLTISWNTNLSNYGLAFFQDMPCNPYCALGPAYLQDDFNEDSTQSFAWTVTPEPYFNINSSNVFWFALYENVSGQFIDATPVIHAHYFNITTAISSSTSTVSASSTTTTEAVNKQTSSITSTSSPSSTTASQTSTGQSSGESEYSSQISTKTPETTTTEPSSSQHTPSSSSESSSSASSTSPSTKLSANATTNSSLSTGAKVGIALGSIALIALLAVIGYALYCYGQQKASKSTNTSPGPAASFKVNSVSGGLFSSGGGNNAGVSRSIGELGSEGPVGEMEGEGRYCLIPGRGRGGVYELTGQI